MYRLIWLADVLRKAGCEVKEVSGWKTAGHGDMKGVRGILCHHTGGAAKGDMPTLQTLVAGRPDLVGPLCQLGLSRSGVYHVIAAGKGWHAGTGEWKPLNLANNGNSWLIGIEAENTGKPDDPWPEAQMKAYRVGCTAILEYCKLPISSVLGHKEYAPGRKVDPSFDMVKFRADIAKGMLIK